ncbi:hypothetical protein PABG_00543 [Paracoccidioides brasiliensis Pb03]|nr:hypothetical protein PABG_00543 [Paracoccidioides brasiliensis Pb03]
MHSIRPSESALLISRHMLVSLRNVQAAARVHRFIRVEASFHKKIRRLGTQVQGVRTEIRQYGSNNTETHDKFAIDTVSKPRLIPYKDGLHPPQASIIGHLPASPSLSQPLLGARQVSTFNHYSDQQRPRPTVKTATKSDQKRP